MVRKGFSPKITPRRGGPPKSSALATDAQRNPSGTPSTGVDSHAFRHTSGASRTTSRSQKGGEPVQQTDEFDAGCSALRPCVDLSTGPTTPVPSENDPAKRRRVAESREAEVDLQPSPRNSVPEPPDSARQGRVDGGPMLPSPISQPDKEQRASVTSRLSQAELSSSAVMLPGQGTELVQADLATTEARRRARKRQPRPPEDQMRVKDHIYFNPPKPKAANGKRKQGDHGVSEPATPAPPASPPPKSTELATTGPATPTPDGAGPAVSAPQVVLDATTGKFVVDPSSLEQRSALFNQEAVGQLVQQRSPASYAAYSKRTASKRWTKDETETFYTGVRTFGLDFDMIKRYFLPDRDHTQLKNKYNREDRADRAKMDFCLDQANRLAPPRDDQ